MSSFRRRRSRSVFFRGYALVCKTKGRYGKVLANKQSKKINNKTNSLFFLLLCLQLEGSAGLFEGENGRRLSFGRAETESMTKRRTAERRKSTGRSRTPGGLKRKIKIKPKKKSSSNANLLESEVSETQSGRAVLALARAEGRLGGFGGRLAFHHVN